MKKIAFSKTIKAGAKGRNGLLRQSGIKVIKSGWEPVKWLHPVTGRGAVSDSCYLTVPNNVAGELAAAITDVDPAIMALFLAMVHENPVTSTLFPAPWSYFIARLGPVTTRLQKDFVTDDHIDVPTNSIKIL